MSTATTSRPRPGLADRLPIIAHTLGGQVRSLMMWSLVLGVLVAIYTSVYPAFADAGGMEAQLEALPPEVVEALGYDIAGTAAGYVQSAVFGLLAMVLLLVHAIGRGSRLLAGEEEDGALELELTSAVSRRRVYVERATTVLLGSAILSVAVAVMTAVMTAALPLDIGAGAILAGGLSLFLLAAATGAVTLAAGAATGRRAVALTAGAALSVIGYIGQAVGPQLEGMEWMGDVTPIGWHLGTQALLDGADPARFGAMAAVAVVAWIIGLAVFTRRDLVAG